jgi:DnaJ like chaperone protein
VRPWLGKVAGGLFGFAVTRHPIGLAVGAAIGHAWDEGWLSNLVPFLEPREGSMVGPLFGLAGVVAKSDGRVSEAEVAAIEKLMLRLELKKRLRARAVEQFERGRNGEIDPHLAGRELRAFCGYRGELKIMLLDVLADVGLADGALAPEARTVLLRAARSLDVAEDTLEWLLLRKTGRSASGGAMVPDPYAVLGVDSKATDAQVRRAFRRLIAEHHPDKQTARGAAPEVVKLSEQRAREIIAAYEQLKAMRGFR